MANIVASEEYDLGNGVRASLDCLERGIVLLCVWRDDGGVLDPRLQKLAAWDYHNRNKDGCTQLASVLRGPEAYAGLRAALERVQEFVNTPPHTSDRP
jgi:hypothetical protein